MSEAIENQILKALSSTEYVVSDAFAESIKVHHQELVGAAKSLEAEGYITAEILNKPVWKLTQEASDIVEKGSPEFHLFSLLGNKELSQTEIQGKLGKAPTAVAMSNGMKAKIFKLSKRDGETYITRSADVFTDDTQSALQRAVQGGHVDPTEVAVLKRRKLATLEVTKVFKYSRGPSYGPERREKAAGDITAKMLQDGSWKTATFKEYNFASAAPEVDGGQLHPLLKTRQEFREILMELGFQEMNTQHWVESSFWNFDSLFIPQEHPARDAQDTFFMSKPSTTELTNRKLLERVRKSHDSSFRTIWKETEASRNVLRTHTTGSTAYNLYLLAQQYPLNKKGHRMVPPGRYYSIDRVFRNEQMDRTHLCEFHQVEGCVVDRNVSLSSMMHIFAQFFRRIGVEKLRFKPTFNPYTEPSMEIFGYHTGLQKWIEVGNSGLFRPELLVPLGFDEEVSVLGWGLSLERPTMIKYGINSIHELFGHRVDVKFIKRSAIARF